MDAIFTIADIETVAAKLWKEGCHKKVWAFYAAMGTGKTTFIHALCQQLGVQSVVSSPTYAIINEYSSSVAGIIYHMDWYRLKGEEEAIQAGVEDLLTSGELCFVEWPENAPGLLADETFHVYMEVLDDQRRRVHTGE